MKALLLMPLFMTLFVTAYGYPNGLDSNMDNSPAIENYFRPKRSNYKNSNNNSQNSDSQEYNSLSNGNNNQNLVADDFRNDRYRTNYTRQDYVESSPYYYPQTYYTQQPAYPTQQFVQPVKPVVVKPQAVDQVKIDQARPGDQYYPQVNEPNYDYQPSSQYQEETLHTQ
jgi:hypothetical protein